MYQRKDMGETSGCKRLSGGAIHRVAMSAASAITLAHGCNDWILDGQPRASRGLSQSRTGERRAAPLQILGASLQSASRARDLYLEFKTKRT